MKTRSIRVGIVGASGYTGGELLRLLLRHPTVQLAWITSRRFAGKPIWQAHEDLYGETDLCFAGAPGAEVDVVFLALQHGLAAQFLEENSPAENTRIIDLSRDFRHTEERSGFVYGLPEMQRAQIAAARRIANPGCFATAVQLALLPLAAAGLLPDALHIHAVTGATGAGRTPSETTHFSWRFGNHSVYRPFQHPHEREILQSLRRLQPDGAFRLFFLPYRGSFARGIYATAYLHSELSLEAARELFEKYYAEHPFIRLVPQFPHLKQVVHTNYAAIHLTKRDDTLLIFSVIDNLLKGAAGQAVQNMNLMLGLPETTGLALKAGAY